SIRWKDRSTFRVKGFCTTYGAKFKGKDYIAYDYDNRVSNEPQCKSNICESDITINGENYPKVQGCSSIKGSLSFDEAFGEATVEFNNLVTLEGDFTLGGNRHVKHIKMDQLRCMSRTKCLGTNKGSAKHHGKVEIEGSKLVSFSANSLERLNQLRLTNNPKLEQLSMANLKSAHLMAIVDNPNLSTPALGSLEEVESDLFIDNSFRGDLKLPLHNVGGPMRIGLGAEGSSIEMLSLRSVGNFTLHSNRTLNTLTIPSLTQVGAFEMATEVESITIDPDVAWADGSNHRAKFFVTSFCSVYSSKLRGKNYINTPDRCESSLCNATIRLTDGNKLHALACEVVGGDYIVTEGYTGTELIHPRLVEVRGDLQYRGSSLSKLSLPNLKTVQGLKVEAVTTNLAVNLDRLVQAIEISIGGQVTESLALPNLTHCTAVTLLNTQLTDLSVPSLSECKDIRIKDNLKLASISFPQLTSVTNFHLENTPSGSNLDLPKLVAVSNDLKFINAPDRHLELYVVTVGGSVILNPSYADMQVMMDTLATVKDKFLFKPHPKASRLSLTALTSAGAFIMDEGVDKISLNPGFRWGGTAKFMADNFCETYAGAFKGKKFTTDPDLCRSTPCDNHLVLDNDNAVVADFLNCAYIDGNLIIPAHFRRNFTHQRLEIVKGNLEIQGYLDCDIEFANLAIVEATLNLTDAGGVTKDSFRALKEASEIHVTGQVVASLDLNRLENCTKLSIAGSRIQQLYAPKLSRVSSVELVNNPRLTTVHLSNLVAAEEVKIVGSPQIHDYNFASLRRITGSVWIQDSFTNYLNLPISVIGGNLILGPNVGLDGIQLPSLISAADFNFVKADATLKALELPSLQTTLAFQMDSKVERIVLNERLTWLDNSNAQATFMAKNFCAEYAGGFTGKNYTTLPEQCRSNLCDRTVVLSDANYRYARECTAIMGDYIIGNNFTKELMHPKLVEVHGNLLFATARAKAIDFSGLRRVSGELSVGSAGFNDTLGNLESAGSIRLRGVAVDKVHLNRLESCHEIQVIDTQIAELVAPKVKAVARIEFLGNPKLSRLNLASLEEAGSVEFSDNIIEELEMHHLSKVDTDFKVSNSFTGPIKFQIRKVGGNLDLMASKRVVDVAFPELVEVKGNLTVREAFKVRNLDLGKLETGGALNIRGPTENLQLNDRLRWGGVAYFNNGNFCDHHYARFRGKEFKTSVEGCESDLCDNTIVLEASNFARATACPLINGDYIIGRRLAKRAVAHKRLVAIRGELKIEATDLETLTFEKLESSNLIKLIDAKGIEEDSFISLKRVQSIFIEGDAIAGKLNLSALTECQRVDVKHTKLISYDLSSLPKIGSLNLVANQDLALVHSDNLSEVGSLTIANNPSLMAFKVSELGATVHQLTNISNSFFGQVTLNLHNIKGAFNLGLSNKVASFTLPLLESCGDFHYQSSGVINSLSMPKLSRAELISMWSKVNTISLNRELSWKDDSNIQATFYAGNFCEEYGRKFIGKNYTVTEGVCRSNLCDKSITLTDKIKDHVFKCVDINGSYTIGPEYAGSAVEHAKLKSVMGKIIIKDPPNSLTKVAFNSLTTIDGGIFLEDVHGVVKESFPKLETCPEINVRGTGFTDLEFISLATCNRIKVENSSLRSFRAEPLRSLDRLEISDNFMLKAVHLPLLNSVNVLHLVRNPAIDDYNFGHLKRIRHSVSISDSFAGDIDLDISEVGGTMELKPHTASKISFHHLESIGARFIFQPSSISPSELSLGSLTFVKAFTMMGQVKMIGLNERLCWAGSATFNADNFCRDYKAKFGHQRFVANGGDCSITHCDGHVTLTYDNLDEVLKCPKIMGDYIIREPFLDRVLNHADLTSISGDLLLASTNPNLAFPRLDNVFGVVKLSGTTGLNEASLSNLESASGIQVTGGTSSNLNLPNLKTCATINITQTNLTGFKVPKLIKLHQLSLEDNARLAEVEMRELAKVDGRVLVKGNPLLSSYDFASLREVEDLELSRSFASAVELPVESITGKLIVELSNPTTLKLDSLRSITGHFSLKPDSQLELLSFKQLVTSGEFTMDGNAREIVLNGQLKWNGTALFNAGNFCRKYSETFRGRKYKTGDGGCSSTLCDNSITLTAENLVDSLACTYISGDLSINSNLNVGAINFTELLTIAGDLKVTNINHPLSFPKLESASTIDLENGAGIRKGSFNRLKRVGALSLSGTLHELSFDELAACSTILVKRSNISHISIPKITHLSGMGFTETALKTLHLNALQSVEESVTFDRCPQLENCHLDRLAKISGNLNVTESFKEKVSLGIQQVAGDVILDPKNDALKLNLANLTSAAGFTMESGVDEITLNAGFHWSGRATFRASNFCARYGGTFTGRDYIANGGECESTLCKKDIILNDETMAQFLRCQVVEGSLTITGEFKDVAFNSEALKEVRGDLIVRDNNHASLHLPSLKRITGSLYLSNATGIRHDSFSNLKETVNILIRDAVDLDLAFAQLITAKKVEVAGSSVNRISIEPIQALDSLNFTNNARLSTVNFHNLTTIHTDLSFDENGGIKAYRFSQLSKVGGNLIIKNSFNGELDLPVKIIGGDVDLDLPEGITGVLMNSLISTNHIRHASNNPRSKLALPNLKTSGNIVMKKRIANIQLMPGLEWKGHATFNADNFCRDYADQFRGKNYHELEGGCKSDICENHIVLTDENVDQVSQCHRIQGNYTIHGFNYGTLNHPNLIRVEGSLNLLASNFDRIQFPQLNTVAEDVTINDTRGLSESSLLQLLTTESILIRGDVGVKLHLDGLMRCETFELGRSTLRKLSAPNLKTVATLQLVDNFNLTDILLPKLDSVDKDFIVVNSGDVDNHVLASLKAVAGKLRIFNSFKGKVEFPVLETLGRLEIQLDRDMNLVDFPKLREMGGELTFSTSRTVQAMRLPALQKVRAVLMANQNPVRQIQLNPQLEWGARSRFLADNFCRNYSTLFRGKNYVTFEGQTVRLSDENVEEVRGCITITGSLIINLGFTPNEVDLPQLKNVTESLEVYGRDLAAVKLKSLAYAKAVKLAKVSADVRDTFPSLTEVDSISVENLNATELALNELKACRTMKIVATALKHLSVARLRNLEELYMEDNLQLRDLRFGALRSISGAMTLLNSRLGSKPFPSLLTVGEILIRAEGSLAIHVYGDGTVDLSRLGSLAGNFSFDGDQPASELNLPKLKRAKRFTMKAKSGQKLSANKGECSSDVCDASVTLTHENMGEVLGCRYINGDYRVDGTFREASILHGALIGIKGSLTIDYPHEKVNLLNFSSLTAIGGDLVLRGAKGIVDDTFSSLGSVDKLAVQDTVAHKLNLDSVTRCNLISLRTSAIFEVSFRGLKAVGEFEMRENHPIQSLLLPNVNRVDGDMVFRDNCHLSSYQLGALTSIGGNLEAVNSFDSLKLNVVEVGGNLQIEEEKAITEVDFPNLANCGGTFHYKIKPKVEVLGLRKLLRAGSFRMESYVQSVNLSHTLTWEGKAAFLADKFCDYYEEAFRGREYTANDGQCGSTLCEGTVVLSRKNAREAFSCAIIDGSYIIHSNYTATDLIHPKLNAIRGSLIINNPSATTIKFENLATVTEAIKITNARGLNNDTFKNVKMAGAIEVQGRVGDHLKMVYLGEVKRIHLHDTSLKAAHFPLLSSLEGLSLEANPTLTDLEIPSLSEVRGDLKLKDNAIKNYDGLLLDEVKGNLSIIKSFEGALQPELAHVGGNFTLHLKRGSTANFPNLKRIGGDFVALSDGRDSIIAMKSLLSTQKFTMGSQVERVDLNPKLQWEGQAIFRANRFCQTYRQAFRGKEYVANNGECESQFCDQTLLVDNENYPKVLKCDLINGDLIVSDAYTEGSFHHPNLKAITENLIINSTVMPSLSFKNLIRVNLTLNLGGNAQLPKDAFESLRDAKGIVIAGLNNTKELKFNHVVNLAYVDVSASNIEGLEFNRLESLVSISFRDNRWLKRLAFGSLEDLLGDALFIGNPTINPYLETFKKLKGLKGSFTIINSSGPHLKLGFETCNRNITIKVERPSGTVVLDALSEVAGAFEFDGPEGTTHLQIPKLVKVGSLAVRGNINAIKLNTLIRWGGEAQIYADNFCEDYYPFFQYRKFRTLRCTRKERNYIMILSSMGFLLVVSTALIIKVVSNQN
ncbi:cell wall protein Ecm33, partial [Massospora cicadina]